MKIIFDSEEQKLHHIKNVCPDDVIADLANKKPEGCCLDDDEGHMSPYEVNVCKKCWENSSIEIVVEESEE